MTKPTEQPLAIAPVTTDASLNTGLSIFDSGTFEALYRVAGALADSSLVPATLRGDTKEQTAANCLRVAEQAARWQLSPFAVCDCASVVHGRLMWEGKLVAAVIEAQLGIRLSYSYSGEGEAKQVVVSGHFANEAEARTITGTVKQWKTHGKGSPWENPDNHERQLAYRGAREWARRHAPAVMLGVYTPDEFDPADMRDVTPRRSLVRRDGPIDPASSLVADPVKQQDKPTDEAKEASPAPAKPRQKKERMERVGVLKKASEHTTPSGKTYWAAVFEINGKQPEFTTFSTTLGEALMTMEYDTTAKLTIVAGSKPGTFTLEDFEIITAEDEGGLL